MDISTDMHGDILALRIKESRLDAAAALSFKEKMRGATASHPGSSCDQARRV